MQIGRLSRNDLIGPATLVIQITAACPSAAWRSSPIPHRQASSTSSSCSCSVVKTWACTEPSRGGSLSFTSAQRYAPVEQLQAVVGAARPTGQVAAVLDDAVFDELQQPFGFRHRS